MLPFLEIINYPKIYTFVFVNFIQILMIPLNNLFIKLQYPNTAIGSRTMLCASLPFLSDDVLLTVR